MGQVRDIMQKNVITIQENKSALDAAKLISEKDISFLVIVKDEKPIGVITERDFVRKIAVQDKQASLTPLSEIMSYKFRWVKPAPGLPVRRRPVANSRTRRRTACRSGTPGTPGRQSLRCRGHACHCRRCRSAPHGGTRESSARRNTDKDHGRRRRHVRL